MRYPRQSEVAYSKENRHVILDQPESRTNTFKVVGLAQRKYDVKSFLMWKLNEVDIVSRVLMIKT